ncbi:FG-GAP-like repeat-containing protein [Streptomyces erythrochromogenes]|uniref:FG-GAP-like repeat-containing protein n=1 Tax=Streptomyces erythrochromogenes TaxID=285574 RepID=UPI0036F6E348
MSVPRPRTARMTGLLAAATAVAAGLTSAGPAQALTGPEAPDGRFASAVRLTVGDEATGRACTAALVDEWWIATAASCFATTAGRPVPAGKPPVKSAVTLADGRALEVSELVPRADRDVVLARLRTPARGAATVEPGASVPAAGTDLTAAGFGRTKTEWVPGRLHSGAFTVASTDATTLAITGKGGDAICKGDTGGPLLNAAGELVGVNSRSWQGGCLGTDPAETRTGAVSARTDDLGQWIATVTDPMLVHPGQIIESGTTLVGKNLKLSMQADGNMVIYHNSGGEGKGAALWSSNTYGNPGAYAIMQADGNFVVHKKDGGDGRGGHLWSTATFGNPDAYLRFQNDGNLVVHRKDGGEGTGSRLWSSETAMRPNTLVGDGRLPAGSWVDGPHRILVMAGDGRLYIWDKNQAKQVWSSDAAGGDGSYLSMQRDGNLVAYRKGGGEGTGNSYWSTATFGNPGAYLAFQNDGNLVVYGKEGGEGKGGALWASGGLPADPRPSAAVNEAGGSDRVRWADFDGDRRPDYITIADNGAVSVWLNRGGDPAGANGWQGMGQVAVGTTTDRSRVRLADFDGDGRADYLVINANGSVNVWLNRGGDEVAPWKPLGQVASGLTTDPGKVRFADWNGDGRTDYLLFNDKGAVDVHINRGGDQVAPWQGIGRVTTGATTDPGRVRFADGDGDGKADYYAVKPDGKVDLYLNRGGDAVPDNGWNVVGQITGGRTTDQTKVQFVDFDADTHADYVLAGNGSSASVLAWNGGDPAGANGWTDLGKVASGA